SILDEEATSGRMPLLFQSKRGGPRQRVTQEFLNEAQFGTLHVDAPSYFDGDQYVQPRLLALGLRPRPHPQTIVRAPINWAVIFERQSAASAALLAMRRLVVFAQQAYLDWLFPAPSLRSDEAASSLSSSQTLSDQPNRPIKSKVGA